jgi:hypothetical protein
MAPNKIRLTSPTKTYEYFNFGLRNTHHAKLTLIIQHATHSGTHNLMRRS